jgi:hypothetical protein
MGLPSRVASLARKLDRAINLGVSAAYPMVFNLPTPDPPPDWKAVVRVAWRAVRATARETVKVLKLQASVENHAGGWQDDYLDED